MAAKSRQAYYKTLTSYKKKISETKSIVEKIQYLRSLHPKMGARKLQYVLAKFHDMKVGRDKLIKLLNENNLLVKRKRKIRYKFSACTTRSDNKIKNISITQPGQVMLSDITYLRTKSRDYFLSLVVDAYSRKIIGSNLSDSLAAASSIKALEQAIEQSEYQYAIHHSDGGSQYTSKEYQNFLAKNNILPSMTKPASPQENPIVERINGILKHEYDLKQTFDSYQTMLLKTNLAIDIYNNIRPHWSLDLNIPTFVHLSKKLSTNFRT